MSEPSEEISLRIYDTEIESWRVEQRNKLVEKILKSNDYYVTDTGDITVTWQDPIKDTYYTLHHEAADIGKQVYRLFLVSTQNSETSGSLVFDNESPGVQIDTGQHALTSYELQESLSDVLFNGVLVLMEKGVFGTTPNATT